MLARYWLPMVIAVNNYDNLTSDVDYQAIHRRCILLQLSASFRVLPLLVVSNAL